MKTTDDYINEITVAVIRFIDRDCDRAAAQVLKNELKNIIYEIETEARLDTRKELLNEFELRRFFED